MACVSKVCLERPWVEVVVFDRIARAQDVGLLQAHHRTHGVPLHIERQRGRDAVRVDLVRVEPLGLQEDLVAGLVGKAIDLVFDARAVARAHSFDHAREHRAAVKALADDLVRALVGVRDPAADLARVLIGAAHEAEHRHRVGVAGLLDQSRDSRSSAHRCAAASRSSAAPAAAPARASAPTARSPAPSPARPPGWLRNPTWMRPFRKVPAVSTTFVGIKANTHLRQNTCDCASAVQDTDHPPPAGTAKDWAASRAAAESPRGTAPDRPGRAWRAPPGPCDPLSIRN